MIEHYIREHQLAHGQALPPERVLAEHLGISRAKLRAELARVEVAGLIWRGVGRGTFVGGRPEKFSPSLQGLKVGTSPSDIAEMRLMVEPSLAGLAALKATPEDLAELMRFAKMGSTAMSDTDWKLYDHNFHLLIAKATRNPAIIALVELINSVRAKPYFRRKAMSDADRAHFGKQHQAIATAIASRDAEQATNALRDHLLGVRQRG
jgi:GntR family transcriptional repressor for pyruvate dehydrogenase complex